MRNQFKLKYLYEKNWKSVNFGIKRLIPFRGAVDDFSAVTVLFSRN